MCKSIIFLVLVTASFFAVEGLYCYQCVYDDSVTMDELEDKGVWGIRGHRSCKQGETPDKDKNLEIRCPSPDKDSTMSAPVCMELYLGNLSARNGSGNHYNISARGCFHTDTTVEIFNMRMASSKRTYGNLTAIAMGRWKGAFEESISYIGNETVGQFSYCKSDGCNPAVRLVSSSWGSLALFAILVAMSTTLNR